VRSRLSSEALPATQAGPARFPRPRSPGDVPSFDEAALRAQRNQFFPPALLAAVEKKKHGELMFFFSLDQAGGPKGKPIFPDAMKSDVLNDELVDFATIARRCETCPTPAGTPGIIVAPAMKISRISGLVAPF